MSSSHCRGLAGQLLRQSVLTPASGWQTLRRPDGSGTFEAWCDFETDGGVWWFGGGSDITPAYLFEEARPRAPRAPLASRIPPPPCPGGGVRLLSRALVLQDIAHFHQTYKDVCDTHDPEYYARFKKWADEYFTIKHRGETRGLGGIFFDDLNDREPDELYNFAMDCLSTIGPVYVPIVVKHKDDEFTTKQKEWQQMRRGRYVEFNLVYDRGTVFGLKTGGRIESILMSLPETARWEYNHKVQDGTPEADIMDAFKNPREWVKA